ATGSVPVPAAATPGRRRSPSSSEVGGLASGLLVVHLLRQWNMAQVLALVREVVEQPVEAGVLPAVGSLPDLRQVRFGDAWRKFVEQRFLLVKQGQQFGVRFGRGPELGVPVALERNL